MAAKPSLPCPLRAQVSAGPSVRLPSRAPPLRRVEKLPALPAVATVKQFRRVSLEAAVGRARVGRDAVRWQGATTLRAHAREEEQRRQRAAVRLNRVRSALTQAVKEVVGAELDVHAVLPAEESGQLPFLGSVHDAREYARRHKAESLPAPPADCPQRPGQPGLCGGSGVAEDLNAGVWRDALGCTDRVMPGDAGTDHRTGARQSTPTLFSATPVLSPSG